MSSHIALKAAWEAFSAQKYTEAAHIAASTLRLEPRNILAETCLVMSEYFLKDNSDASLRAMKKLVKRAPHIPMLHVHLGSIYAFKGDMEKAQAAYEAADRLEPSDPFNFVHLTTVKKFTEFDPFCQRMQALYDKGEEDPSKLVALCFGLAKVYDDLGDYEKAIHYCMKGNAARGYKFAPLLLQKHLSAIKELGKSGEFSQLATSGLGTNAPLFIVGMPRSGTSLAETILGRHPLVRACGEMADAAGIERSLIQGFPSLRQKQTPVVDMLSLVSSSDLETKANVWLDRVARQPGGRYERFTDKMPGNAVRLGLIAKLFPNARIIYMQRNALDCCISNLFARFGGVHAHTTRQDWLGMYFRYTEDVVAEWRKIIDLPVLDMHYEDLVSTPERETRRMLEFAGLQWDDSCLDHTKGNNEVRTATAWQARQPINRKSVDRWRRYEPWIQELIEALGGYEALGVEKGNGI